MKKTAIGLCAALFVAGCTQIEVTTPPINVTPTNPAGANGLDVYARDRAAGNPVPRFRGQDTVSVRTRQIAEGGGGTVEVGQAQCTLDSGVYRAQFQTPANIVVPDYGPDSPSIFVRCVRGELSGSFTAEVYNATTAARQASGAGAGLLGVLVVTAITAARENPERDDFQYRPIVVPLR